MKQKQENEIEMIVEAGVAEPKADAPSVMGDALNENQQNLEEQSLKQEEKAPTALQRMRESASEDDAPVGTLTLKQIVGGDYLFALVRHHVALIMFIVFFFVFYVGVRYQCEQDVLEIDQLEKNLVDAKYKAMASSSNLTELCRQSNVLKNLREHQDTLLQLSDQPPYIIEVPEE